MKSLTLDGVEYPVKHYPTTCDRHTVVMLSADGSKTLAYLTWHEFTGEIRQVRVECPGHSYWEENGGDHYCYRRRGISTALLAIARSFATVPIVHSKTRTDAGEAWAHAVARPGEAIPPRQIFESCKVDHQTMEELING